MPIAEASGLHQSVISPHRFKEKAFTVKEVVISKNAFARRGSKKSKPRSPSLLPREKSSMEKMKLVSTEMQIRWLSHGFGMVNLL